MHTPHIDSATHFQVHGHNNTIIIAEMHWESFDL
jgi:hypothetical protein